MRTFLNEEQVTLAEVEMVFICCAVTLVIIQIHNIKVTENETIDVFSLALTHLFSSSSSGCYQRYQS